MWLCAISWLVAGLALWLLRRNALRATWTTEFAGLCQAVRKREARPKLPPQSHLLSVAACVEREEWHAASLELSQVLAELRHEAASTRYVSRGAARLAVASALFMTLLLALSLVQGEGAWGHFGVVLLLFTMLPGLLVAGVARLIGHNAQRTAEEAYEHGRRLAGLLADRL